MAEALHCIYGRRGNGRYPGGLQDKVTLGAKRVLAP